MLDFPHPPVSNTIQAKCKEQMEVPSTASMSGAESFLSRKCLLQMEREQYSLLI